MNDERTKKLIEMGILPNPDFQPRETSKNRFGRMTFAHKTGGEVEIFTADSFEATKKYYVANGARSAVKNFSKNTCT
jgi:hypothetical protein